MALPKLSGRDCSAWSLIGLRFRGLSRVHVVSSRTELSIYHPLSDSIPHLSIFTFHVRLLTIEMRSEFCFVEGGSHPTRRCYFIDFRFVFGGKSHLQRPEIVVQLVHRAWSGDGTGNGGR